MEGVIYIIKCRDEKIQNVYIGSTFDFNQRCASHRSISKNPKQKGYNIYLYEFIRENGGFENWRIEILEINYFESKEQLRFQEREYMKEYPLLLNTNQAAITENERKEKIKIFKEIWVKENRERCKIHNKKWIQKNKEKINEYQREYYHKKKREKENGYNLR